jgi:Leucine-rich repeat (LRR) protein
LPHLLRAYNTCKLDGQTINDVGFSVASPADSTVQAFYISNNPMVEYLPENLSEKFPNIVAAGVWDCGVKSINEKNFKGLHKLIVLNLINNMIEGIDSNAFKDNKKLEYLRLDGNKIKFLHPGTLETLSNLKHVSFENNQLESIDPDMFNKKNLTVILKGNKCIDVNFSSSSFSSIKNDIAARCTKFE